MSLASSRGQGSRAVAALLLCFVVLSAVVLPACGDDAPQPPDGTSALTITNNAGKEQTLFIEIAETPEQRSIGLSNRRELPEDQGMLFIIPTRGVGFWMKDTLIPLSVAFIGQCGEIVHIADMEPQTDMLHHTDREYKFGLEVNQGWFPEHGIDVGSEVEIPEAHRYPECA